MEVRFNDFKSAKVITKSLRHPSHFLKNLMGKISCPSSKYRKIQEFSANIYKALYRTNVKREKKKRIKNELKEN